VRVRHILLAVTPGVDVTALRKQAETVYLDVRCHDGTGDGFAEAARKWSNCPSGEHGGDLFGRVEVGVLPRLVHSRFGLHIVEVLERHPGAARPFEAVRGAVAAALKRQAFATALRQYLQLLAGAADVEGVDLDAADTPLVR
jgi:peptidyl-prolyl cis-trans isomerase C